MLPGRKLQLEFARRNFWLVPSRMNPGISIVSHPRARGLGIFTAPRFLLSFAEAIFRMRRLLMLLGIVFLCSISALAQNSMDFFGGSCYEGLGRLPQAMPARNPSGVKVAVQYNFRKCLGIRARWRDISAPNRLHMSSISWPGRNFACRRICSLDFVTYGRVMTVLTGTEFGTNPLRTQWAAGWTGRWRRGSPGEGLKTTM